MTPEEMEIVKKVLTSNAVQLLIGAEEWDLTDDEETKLWEIIEKIEGGKL